MPARAPEKELTVAVTGPTGEIGQALVASLERAREVKQILGMARRPFNPREPGLDEGALPARGRAQPPGGDGAGARRGRGRPPRVHDHGQLQGEPPGQPRRVSQRVRGVHPLGGQEARVRLLGGRLRIPPRQPPAADRGRARPRQQPALLLGPEGGGRAAAVGDVGSRPDEGVRVPAVHRGRAESAAADRQPALHPDLRSPAGAAS